MKSAIFLILILIPSITALKCYVCNSIENSACGNSGELDDNMVQTCVGTPTETYCRKIDQTINGQKSVVRACGLKIGAKSCYKTAGANSANVCSCNDRDQCNHAANFPRQQQNLFALLSSTIGLAMAMIFLR